MVFLTRIDSAQQVQRFWLSMMTPTLLGGWSLVHEWGRIGFPGTVQARSFGSETEATEVAIATASLNRMLEFGRPSYVRIA